MSSPVNVLTGVAVPSGQIQASENYWKNVVEKIERDVAGPGVPPNASALAKLSGDSQQTAHLRDLDPVRIFSESALRCGVSGAVGRRHREPMTAKLHPRHKQRTGSRLEQSQ